MTPNVLTVARIFLSPLFIAVFMFDSFPAYVVCFILSILMELSDFFDGKLARRYKQISDFGKLMDPFADSISRFTIFLCFLSAGWAPLWMIAIFFYRDVLVSVIRVFAMKQGTVVAARKSGKTKAWVQAVCIWLVMIVVLLERSGIAIEFFSIPGRTYLLTSSIIAISAVITLWSGYDYWAANKSAVLNSN
jgi:CDP-diacylglycerol--glycerol-3-phosphate 3-phosphatidyltransferase